MTHTLARARLLTGRVTAAATGRPVAARLSVYAGTWAAHHDRYTVHTAAPELAPEAPPLELDGRAGADGRFRLRLPAEGPYRVAIHPPEGEPCVGVLRELDWAAGETLRELEVALPAGVEVRGRVVESDGRPVVGACVYYNGSRAENPLLTSELLIHRDTAVLTGPDGVFRLAVPPGWGWLEVFGPTPDFLTWTYDIGVCTRCGRKHGPSYEHGRIDLDLPPDRLVELVTVKLRRGEVVEGEVLGPDCVPVREGVLISRAVVQPLRSLVVRPLPFREGTFALPGCDPGRVYPVALFDGAGRLGAIAELRPGENAKVRLEKCGSAEVRLVDGAGRSIAGARATLTLWLDCNRPAKGPAGDAESWQPVDQAWFDARDYLPGPATGMDGRVHLPALVPQGKYTVWFEYGGRDYRTQPFRVGPGELVRLPDVVVAPADHKPAGNLAP